MSDTSDLDKPTVLVSGQSPVSTVFRLVQSRRQLVERRVEFDRAVSSLQAAPGLAESVAAIRAYVNGLEAVLALEVAVGVHFKDGLEEDLA